MQPFIAIKIYKTIKQVRLFEHTKESVLSWIFDDLGTRIWICINVVLVQGFWLRNKAKLVYYDDLFANDDRQLSANTNNYHNYPLWSFNYAV